LFAKADMATSLFPEIVSSVDVRVPAADGEGYIAANDNQLLYQYPGALGGKTGFTDDAGNTYVGMAGQNGRRLVVTMMHGTQQPRRQWMQGASLLDWGFALPATTPPVGKLVGSLAEATAAAAQPTVSTGAPASSSLSDAETASASPEGPSTNAANVETTSSTNGTSTPLILAGIGVLIVALGILLLLRRRHLNKRPVFAGDAKPADDAARQTEETPPEEMPDVMPSEPAAEDADPPEPEAPAERSAPEPEAAAENASPTATDPPTAAGTEPSQETEPHPASEPNPETEPHPPSEPHPDNKP
jgi:D-alanyl-D-alanine carboxypeptidase (penicillin-binding protein 5/6)